MAAAVAMQAIGLGLTGVSMLAEGAGNRAAAEESARRAEVGRRVAQIQSEQIDASYRGELDTVIRNIKAVQASSGAPLDAPSTVALMDREAEASDSDRRVAVANARLQASGYAADSAAFKIAGRAAFGAGLARGAASFAEIGSLNFNRP